MKKGNTMHITKITLIIFISALGFSLSAQKPIMKWGKVDDKVLEMSTYPGDKEADAVILGAFGYLTFDLTNPKYVVAFEQHHRIKLFNQNGIDTYGNQRISYYSFEGSSDVTSLKAQVILPDGSKISIDKKDIVDQKLDDYWSEIVIPFSNLEPGAIIEYQFTLRSNYTVSLVDWYFQREIPVRQNELYMKVPMYYEYIVLNQGMPLTVNEKNRINENVTFKVSGQNAGRNALQRQRQNTTMETVSVPMTEYRMGMRGVRVLKKEAYITTMDDHYSRVRFQLQRVAYPNSPARLVMASWHKLADDLMRSPSFGMQIKAGKNKK